MAIVFTKVVLTIFFVVNKILTDCEIKKLAKGPNACNISCNLSSSQHVTGVSVITPTVSGSCGGKIDISWDLFPVATYYDVYRYNATGSLETIISNIATTSYRDTVSFGTNHGYAVQAFNTYPSFSATSSIFFATSTNECPATITASCNATQPGQPNTDVLSGESVKWVSNVTPNNGIYAYFWSGAVTGTGSFASTTYVNNNSGSIVENVMLKVSSGSGAYYQERTVLCSVNVWKSFNTLNDIICSVSPTNTASSTYVNKSISWQATVPSNISLHNVMYSWIGDEGLLSSGTSSTTQKIYTTLGIKNATSTVTGLDSNNAVYRGVCSASTNIILQAGAGGSVER